MKQLITLSALSLLVLASAAASAQSMGQTQAPSAASAYPVTPAPGLFEAFGGQTGIRERLHVLATKGHVKFVRGDRAAQLGLKRDRSKFGYLCVRDMSLRTAEEMVDEETGEVLPAFARVLPTDFMCPQTGALLPVENPEIWVDQDGGDA